MNLLNVRNFNDQTGAAHKKNSNLFQIKFFRGGYVSIKNVVSTKKKFITQINYTTVSCV